MIMLNFNNTITSKIISLIIAVSFLMADISYARAYQQGGLRVPVGQEVTQRRVGEVIIKQAAAKTPTSGGVQEVVTATEDASLIEAAIAGVIGNYAKNYADEHGDVWKVTSHGIFVPTNAIAVRIMLDKAGIGQGIIFGDLGSGLGDMLFRAAERGADVVGWEIDNELFTDSCNVRADLRKYPQFARANIKIINYSYLEEDSGIEECDVLYWYYNQNSSLGSGNEYNLQTRLRDAKFKPRSKLIVYGGKRWPGFNLIKKGPEDLPIGYHIYEADGSGLFVKFVPQLQGFAMRNSFRLRGSI